MSLVESTQSQNQLILTQSAHDVDNTTPSRTSTLMAPNIQLTGHQAAVNSVQFSPNGSLIASAGRDQDIFLWSMTSEDVQNIDVIKSAAKLDILQVVWTSDSLNVASASADGRACLFDIETSSKIKTMEHDDVVNSISATRQGAHHFLTVGDDRYAAFWDVRMKDAVSSIEFPYQLTCCALSGDGRLSYVAGIDETIYCFDSRSSRPLFYMQGHKDIITGLALSSDGSTLLSNAMDHTLRTWDARLACPAATESDPAANGPLRALGQYAGHSHDAAWQLMRCAFNADDSKISTGSADGFVYVWDTATFELRYKLPGHKAHVNEVAFHPTQPIIASASSDHTIFLGELAL